jgi:hypothetical protein
MIEQSKTCLEQSRRIEIENLKSNGDSAARAGAGG